MGSSLSEYKQLLGGVEFVDVIPKSAFVFVWICLYLFVFVFVEFVDVIPRSASGKILRKELKAEFLRKI